MKLLYIWISALLLDSGCTLHANGYTIRECFPGLQDGMTVRLVNAETRNEEDKLLASDTVENGRFELKGSVDAPVMCHLWISNKNIVDDKKQQRSLGTRLLLDNSDIEIETPCSDILYYISKFGPDARKLQTKITGGTAQRDYMDYHRTVHAHEYESYNHNSELSSLNWDKMATPDKYTPEEYARLRHYASLRPSTARPGYSGRLLGIVVRSLPLSYSFSQSLVRPIWP